MAKITNYTTLRDNIQQFIKRTDALPHLDTFIGLAEVDLWESLRVREMEVRATALTSTVDRFLDLPTGFIKMRRLQILVNDSYYDMGSINPKSMNIANSTGAPSVYTITSQIEFNRVSDSAYTVEMQYIKEPDAITASNTTNEVLTAYPLAYLAGALVHAFNWAMMPEQANYWLATRDQQIASANRKSRNGRYGPTPSIRLDANYP